MSWLRNQWDRVVAWLVVGVGALVLILGWVGVTSTPYTFEQIPYVISGGLGGIFLLGIGAMLWISADLRDEWRVLDELLDRDRQAGESPVDTPQALSAEEAPAGNGSKTEAKARAKTTKTTKATGAKGKSGRKAAATQ